MYKNAADFPAGKHLRYVVLNLRANSTKAVALIRWNVRTAQWYEELVEREFRVVDLRTGVRCGRWSCRICIGTTGTTTRAESTTICGIRNCRSFSPFPPIYAKYLHTMLTLS